jgi:hypothetical protein
MKKRLYSLVFILAVAVSLALVGCSGSSKGGTGQIDLVPERANMIACVKLSRITADGDIAEVYAALPKEAADSQTIEKALAEAMDASYLDLRNFEEGLVFSDISEGAEDDYAGTILRGTFEESSLLAGMKLAVGEGFAIIDYQGYKIYTWSGQETGLAVLTSDLLVTGSVPAIKDVIEVSEGNMPSVSGDVLTAYKRLGDALVKLVVPSEPIVPRVREFTTDSASADMKAALDDMEMFSLAMVKNGHAISLNSVINFSKRQSADAFKGMILLAPILIGDTRMPKSVIQDTDEAIMALLPALLNESDVQTSGSNLKITSDLTVSDIADMSAIPTSSGLAAAVAVNIGSLTSSGLGLSIDASISNNTPMGLDMDEMHVAVTSKNGRIYTESDAAKSSIPAGATTRFQSNIVIPLDMVSERDLLITVDGSAGAIGRSIPFSASVSLTTGGIESLIAVPEIDVEVDFGDLAADGLHMMLETNLSNSNPFGLDVGDLQIVAKGQSGNVVLTKTMKGCSIGPDATGTISGDLSIPLGALNESSIVITVQTQVGLAGITLPINAKVTMQVPDLGSLFDVPAIDLGVDFGELTSDGLQMTLQTTITNSNPFAMNVDDLMIVVKDDEPGGTEYVKKTMKGCSIGPDATGTISGDLLIPLGILDKPRTIAITVGTRAGFAGLNLPITARVTMKVPDVENLVAIPEIYLGVAFGEEFTTDGELRMTLLATITNPSGLDLVVGNLEIVATGQSGHGYINSTMAGCSIGPYATGTISGDLLIPLTVLSEPSIVMTVQTEAVFAGITLPLNAKMAIQVPDIERLIDVPEIDLGVAFGELTSDNLQMKLKTTITNPNPFGLDVGNLQIVAKGQSGNVVLTKTITGCSIGPGATGTISDNISIPIAVLNEPILVITVQTQAGIAGVTLPINAKVTVTMPDIGSLIPGLSVEISAEADFGLLSSTFTVKSVIHNPSNVDLIVGAILVRIFDEDGVEVDRMTMPGGTITAKSSQTFSKSMTLSTSDLLSLLRSKFSLVVTTEVGIVGLNATIPVEAVVTMTLNLPIP